jgi:hypothetical protein
LSNGSCGSTREAEWVEGAWRRRRRELEWRRVRRGSGGSSCGRSREKTKVGWLSHSAPRKKEEGAVVLVLVLVVLLLLLLLFFFLDFPLSLTYLFFFFFFFFFSFLFLCPFFVVFFFLFILGTGSQFSG